MLVFFFFTPVFSDLINSGASHTIDLIHWGGINCISEGEVWGGKNTLRVFGRTVRGHLVKGCLFVGALGEAVSDEVSRSWKALPHDTSLAHGSGHQQLYCFPNNCFHGTAMQIALVILAGGDVYKGSGSSASDLLWGEGSRRNLDRTGLMRVWSLSRACNHKVHIQLNWLLPYAFNPFLHWSLQ